MNLLQFKSMEYDPERPVITYGRESLLHDTRIYRIDPELGLVHFHDIDGGLRVILLPVDILRSEISEGELDTLRKHLATALSRGFYFSVERPFALYPVCEETMDTPASMGNRRSYRIMHVNRLDNPEQVQEIYEALIRLKRS